MRSMSFVASLGIVGLVAAESARAGEPGAAVGGLVLTVEPKAPTGNEGITKLKVTFRNAGTQPVTFFIPEHFSAATFPAIRFVREDGAAFEPYEGPYQSMWTTGIQGALPELAPGKSWSTDYDVDLVVKH